MTVTFTPPADPVFATQKEATIRVLQAQFGDGYTQRVADGLNSYAQNYTVVWTGLIKLDADEIEDFFVTQGGFQEFLYTMPLGPTLKFVCKKWTRGANSYTDHSINATFEQVFDL